MAEKYIGIYFDFFGTLIDSQYFLTHVWARIAKKLGKEIEFSDPRIEQGILKQLSKFNEKNYFTHQLTQRQKNDLNAIVLKTMGIEIKNTEKLVATEFKEGFSARRDIRLNPNCKTTLEQLSALDLKIGLLSHASSSICKPVLERFELLEYFDIFILTEDTGFSKSQIETYEIALKAMNTGNPEKVMHVGDDVKYDAKMAQKVGMTPLLFDPRHENTKEDFIIIHDLEEVLYYLGK